MRRTDRHWMALALALFLAVGLCACGVSQPPSIAGGTWTRLEEPPDQDQMWDSYTYSVSGRGVPEDWNLPEGTIGPFTRTEICSDWILYGDYHDMVLLDGFTVSRYTDGTLHPVYTFDEGMTVTWQRFFSPDGTKLVFPWKTDLGSPQWRIRVVDLSTGGETDLDIPEWEGETEVLLVKWQDDTTIQATACQFTSSAAGRMASWTYAVPR